MEYVKLGQTGLEVSKLCLGCMSFGDASLGFHSGWLLDEEKSRVIIKKALDLGINFFDTANGYAAGTSEEYLGRALKDFDNREDIVLATKCYFSDLPNGEKRPIITISRARISSIRSTAVWSDWERITSISSISTAGITIHRLKKPCLPSMIWSEVVRSAIWELPPGIHGSSKRLSMWLNSTAGLSFLSCKTTITSFIARKSGK